MTKKEQKYINSLKEENDGLRSLLIRFIDEVGKLTNIDDVVNMSLIPLMTEKTKKFKSEFKAEAYKEFAEKVDGVVSKMENELPENQIVLKTIQVYKNIIQMVLKELVGEDK